MDTNLNVDAATGNGTMIFYAFGRSWQADLYGWRVKTPRRLGVTDTLGPEEEPSPARITNWAQWLINRYFQDAELPGRA